MNISFVTQPYLVQVDLNDEYCLFTTNPFDTKLGVRAYFTKLVELIQHNVFYVGLFELRILWTKDSFYPFPEIGRGKWIW